MSCAAISSARPICSFSFTPGKSTRISAPRRRKYSRALRPIVAMRTRLPSLSISRHARSPARLTFELKPPARPRSLPSTTSSTSFSSRRASSGCTRSPSSTRCETPRSTSAVFTANGRSSMMRCCARRSFAAATIFIARVIFWVDFTDPMRFRMALSDGISMRLGFRLLLRRRRLLRGLRFRLLRFLVAREEPFVELRHGSLERGFEAFFVADFLLADVLQNVRVLRVEEGIELLLPTREIGDGDLVDVAVRRRPDRRDLLLD